MQGTIILYGGSNIFFPGGCKFCTMMKLEMYMMNNSY
jgi:hypothetical protein